MPVVVVKSSRDVDLDYLEDDQEFDVAALGITVFTVSSERWKAPMASHSHGFPKMLIPCLGLSFTVILMLAKHRRWAQDAGSNGRQKLPGT